MWLFLDDGESVSSCPGPVPGGDRLRQSMQHVHRLLPTHARVRDALTVGHDIRFVDFLASCHQMTFQHDAEDGAVLVLAQLPSDVPGDDSLAPVVLA